MQISGLELRNLVLKLNSILLGYYVNNIYPVDEESILIRLHHSELQERNLVLSPSRGIWLTRYDLVSKPARGISLALRRQIGRAKILSLKQPGFERVVFLELESSKGSRRLILELFAHGNIICTDQNNNILGLLRTLKVRHRELAVGRRYILPPPRGLDLETLSLDQLQQLKSSDLEIARWMGRNLALSKKYIDEILLRAGIESKIKGNSLDSSAIQRLYETIQELMRQVLTEEGRAVVVYDDETPVEASPIPLEVHSKARVKRFSSFVDALDELFTHEIISKRKELVIKPLKSRLEELDSSIEAQKKARDVAVSSAEALRVFGSRVRDLSLTKGFLTLEELDGRLEELGAKDVFVKGDRLFFKVSGNEFEFELKTSPMKLVSKIYDKAKFFERRAESILRAEESLIERRSNLLSSLEREELEERLPRPSVRRERAWFERFRWFYTSEGFLALGGRDAQSNSILVRRYMNSDDIVFHADLHGSPFFILKDAANKAAISIQEVAQAVVSYSSAWKDEISSADAYWVRPEQVSASAPTGMYLPRGSFMIRGSKNFVKRVKVELAVGICRLEDGYVVCGGPPSALEKRSLAYVIISPEKVKLSDSAKKIKSELVKLLDVDVARYVKKISLDDFLRVMPSSGCRIIYSSLGGQTVKRSDTST